MPTHARLRFVVLLLCLLAVLPACHPHRSGWPGDRNPRGHPRPSTSQSFQQIVQGMGFETVRLKDDAGKDKDYFSFQAEGYKVVAFTYKGYLQFYVGFAGVKPTLAAANEWNAKHSLTRTYADKDGDAVLESDLYTDGGVTRQTVESWIKDFRTVVSPWYDYIKAHQQ